jgi:hypothetical protein
VTETLHSILHRIQALELELKAELARRADAANFSITQGRIHFDAATHSKHKGLKVNVARYVFGGGRPQLLLTMPFIYLVAVPLLLLDAIISLYQAACFPIYGIPKVTRHDYLVFDRGKLAYLNSLEKVHCVYCSYANGLLAYAREIVARTEQYWCPIKHAHEFNTAHSRYPKFFEYGDAEAYRRELDALREELVHEHQQNPPR